MNEIRSSWEDRARDKQRQLSGVLYQNLSEAANRSIDVWHQWLVRDIFSIHMPQGATVLDLGCGYGRLSHAILGARSDIQMIGQDFALEYCRIFAKNAGTCVLANASELPFPSTTFDGVLAVTCLMYLDDRAVKSTLSQLRSVLKSGGIIFALDPGAELLRIIGALRARRGRAATGGRGFQKAEYREFFDRDGFSIVAQGGNPYLSHSLLIPGVARSQNRAIQSHLVRRSAKDCIPSGYEAFALHRWILARKSD